MKKWNDKPGVKGQIQTWRHLSAGSWMGALNQQLFKTEQLL